MKKIYFLIMISLLIVVSSVAAQTEPKAEEPTVTIKQETADKCKQCFIERKAQDEEIAAKNKAIADLKDEINKLKIELAQKTGELIANDAERARLTVIVDMLIKNPRRQIKVGLLNF